MADTLSLFSLPIGIGLGALHALEPGHSKTMVAAFLIGIRGTRRDAFWLGIAAAATHSIVVIGLSVAALWLGRTAMTDSVIGYLQLASGLVVLAVGAWMLWRRWPRGAAAHHHHTPEPVRVASRDLGGLIDIVVTPAGERMRFMPDAPRDDVLGVEILIQRLADQVERLPLRADPARSGGFISDVAPDEPHEFQAELRVMLAGREELIPFSVSEPEHAHSDLDDDAHARAHAAAMPTYAKNGERPSFGQILAFGAAGGMIPCPASITVMLLALSTFSPEQFAIGVAAVFCFSIGLAAALVGIGMLVVTGAKRASSHPVLAKAARHAPVLSAGVIMLSGAAAVALAFTHHGH